MDNQTSKNIFGQTTTTTTTTIESNIFKHSHGEAVSNPPHNLFGQQTSSIFGQKTTLDNSTITASGSELFRKENEKSTVSASSNLFGNSSTFSKSQDYFNKGEHVTQPLLIPTVLVSSPDSIIGDDNGHGFSQISQVKSNNENNIIENTAPSLVFKSNSKSDTSANMTFSNFSNENLNPLFSGFKETQFPKPDSSRASSSKPDSSRASSSKPDSSRASSSKIESRKNPFIIDKEPSPVFINKITTLSDNIFKSESHITRESPGNELNKPFTTAPVFGINKSLGAPTSIFGKPEKSLNKTDAFSRVFGSKREDLNFEHKREMKKFVFDSKEDVKHKPLFATKNIIPHKSSESDSSSLFGGASKSVVPVFSRDTNSKKEIVPTLHKDEKAKLSPVPIFGSNSDKISKSSNIFGASSSFKVDDGSGYKLIKNIPESLNENQPQKQDIIDDDFWEKLQEEDTKEVVKKVEPTLLIAVDIDEKCLNRAILTAHFNKFGKVSKVLINKKSNQASIYFADHKSAANAKARGKRLHPKIPEMKLFYGAIPQEKSKITFTKRNKDSLMNLPMAKKGNIVEGRPMIQYGEIDEFPFNKPSGPIPKMKTSRILNVDSDTINKRPLEMTETKSNTKLIRENISHKDDKTLFKSKPVKSNERIAIKSKPSDELSGSSVVRKSDGRNKAPTVNITAIKDNELLMKQQTHNNYDKFLVLDARDKNLRTRQLKIYDVKKAHYLLATCPDMCPEKERYSRDIQYDLSVYEMTNGAINHKLCVKKFSRSSADKDEPLPHELRPGHVLKITIDYLICNIIDFEEDHSSQLDVWYNYLCNRTRGLRNDIMTQHLVDKNAVYVLERITRFHIHCSHCLCEEPADLFDSKMNSEHLTKSLQSLKESYYDMKEKNIFFNTEAEFRAYEVLLDANDGNVMFKYLNFRESVRNSSEVQFAMKVVHAIQTNNYISFFKLLKDATYLQACIIHKHFLSVRLKALKVIAKAYSFPKEAQILPASFIMSKFGFSNEDKFKNFIQYFGLTIDADSKINIHKGNVLIDPENLPPLQKSIDIVEAKKDGTTGLIVNGGLLPMNPLASYIPHNSFNSAGYLKQTAYNANDQGVQMDHEEKPEEFEAVDISHEEEIKSELESKIDMMYQLNLAKRYFNKWQNFANIQREKKIADEKLTLKMKNVINHWRNYTTESKIRNQRVDHYIIKKYFLKLKAYGIFTKEKRLLYKKVNYLLERIIMKKVTTIWKTYIAKCKKERALRSLRKQIITRKFFINWQIKTILLALERKVDLYYKSKLVKTSLLKWRDWIAERKSRRKVNPETFPACGSQLSPEKQNELWDWSYKRDRSINLSVPQIMKIDKEILERSKKQMSLQKLSGLLAWSTLPLVQRFQSTIDSFPAKVPLYTFYSPFKISIMIDPSADPYFIEWVRTKFNFMEVDELHEPLKSKICLRSRSTGAKYIIMVEELDFNYNISDMWTSLIVVICNRERIGSAERLLDDHFGKSLILSWTWDEYSCQDDVWLLNKEAVDNPLTSEKLFYNIFTHWKVNAEMTIQRTTLTTLVTSFISKKILGPVSQIARNIFQQSEAYLSPHIFASYYNDGLLHLIKCFEKSREIRHMTCNKWTNETIDDAIMYVRKAMLPNFDCAHVPNCGDIDDFITSYVNKFIDPTDWTGNFLSEVSKIIKNSLNKSLPEKENQASYKTRNVATCTWLDIISCCIFYKISFIPEIHVFYEQRILDQYENQEWISQLKRLELGTIKKLPNIEMQKRKALEYPPSPSQPKQKQKKISSQLLEDIRFEKEQTYLLEQQFESTNEIENELKLLQQKYKL